MGTVTARAATGTDCATPDFRSGTPASWSGRPGTSSAVSLFNVIDRTVVNVLAEPIRAAFGFEGGRMGRLGGQADRLTRPWPAIRQ